MRKPETMTGKIFLNIAKVLAVIILFIISYVIFEWAVLTFSIFVKIEFIYNNFEIVIKIASFILSALTTSSVIYLFWFRKKAENSTMEQEKSAFQEQKEFIHKEETNEINSAESSGQIRTRSGGLNKLSMALLLGIVALFLSFFIGLLLTILLLCSNINADEGGFFFVLIFCLAIVLFIIFALISNGTMLIIWIIRSASERKKSKTQK